MGEQRIMTNRKLWLRQFRPAPTAGVRLVCFPHAGGSASYFLPMVTALAPDVDVIAVQYPGRQDRHREPLVDNIVELATTVAGLLDDEDGRPTALFGHSMGALVAFEVARLLEKRGPRPAALFVSGRSAPSVHNRRSTHLLPDADLIADVKRLSGTDSRIWETPDMVEMVLPVIRNDYRAVNTYTYVPGPDVSCDIMALIGDEDTMVTPDKADQWGAHTTGSFTRHIYPGGHFYLDTHFPAVSRRIAEYLTKAAG
ncbi:thioesterase II family protein [Amycolatopsis pigmentata]|uniref:Thioesterase II family protein n=1 Tax=Amycolatopsis pigmentata TaxID=450801 RepID=A0ABW5FQB1_9PSEU